METNAFWSCNISASRLVGPMSAAMVASPAGGAVKKAYGVTSPKVPMVVAGAARGIHKNNDAAQMERSKLARKVSGVQGVVSEVGKGVSAPRTEACIVGK